MAPSEVEERMSAFYERKYDVLLSTTIVESGLDIPSANTIIVHRADRFGLAQLYQLRGRVGRSKLRAYAYLTTPPDKALTEVAEKRLKVLAISTASAPASSSPATISTFAARAICWATSSRAISARSASNSTSRCWRTPSPGAKGGEDERSLTDRGRRRSTSTRRYLIPEDYVPDLQRAHVALSPPDRARERARTREPSPPS